MNARACLALSDGPDVQLPAGSLYAGWDDVVCCSRWKKW